MKSAYLVAQGYANLCKMACTLKTGILRVWMLIIHSHPCCFFKFAYLRFTLYADNIRFSHKPNLKHPNDGELVEIISVGACTTHRVFL